MHYKDMLNTGQYYNWLDVNIWELFFHEQNNELFSISIKGRTNNEFRIPSWHISIDTSQRQKLL